MKKKGFGFILSSDKNEIFVHFKDIVGEGFKTLLEGDRVEFEAIEGTKGVKASNVRVISKS